MSCPVHLAFRRRLPNWVQCDWLGNQTAADDDSHGIYDRSLGTVTNNTASQKPYQLAGAEQTAGTKTGALATKYDEAGNLVAMAVRRDGPCYPEGAVCSQQYRYEWDEVGRLVEAKRWDVQGPSLDSAPVGPAAAHLRYGYEASDNRVIKTATDDQGEQVHTVYIFGSLELRRAQFDAVESPNDYTDDIDTEVGYLFAHGVRLARLHWDDNGSPVLGGANLHVLFGLGEHLGSSSKVLDKATGELVEASTYMGYGQAESDYRPGRWKNFREDYRFTGKEEDAEVGLTYFGKRFLSPALGRWVGADPLTAHTAGADLNAYSYVKGAVLKATDPVGLEPPFDPARTPIPSTEACGSPLLVGPLKLGGGGVSVSFGGASGNSAPGKQKTAGNPWGGAWTWGTSSNPYSSGLKGSIDQRAIADFGKGVDNSVKNMGDSGEFAATALVTYLAPMAALGAVGWAVRAARLGETLWVSKWASSWVLNAGINAGMNAVGNAANQWGRIRAKEQTDFDTTAFAVNTVLGGVTGAAQWKLFATAASPLIRSQEDRIFYKAVAYAAPGISNIVGNSAIAELEGKPQPTWKDQAWSLGFGVAGSLIAGPWTLDSQNRGLPFTNDSTHKKVNDLINNESNLGSLWRLHLGTTENYGADIVKTGVEKQNASGN